MKRALLLLALAGALVAGCFGDAGAGFGQVHRIDMGDVACFVVADLDGTAKSIDCLPVSQLR